MPSAMRPFFTALACSWIALVAVAAVYSKQHPQSHWIMTAALPAFLLEALFYLGSIFAETRAWFSRFSTRRTQALLLWLSALVPYLLFALRAGTFHKNAFLVVALLTGVLSYWYTVLPRRLSYDIGFLIITAAPIILRVFPRVYVASDDQLRDVPAILGHLMWIRVAIVALLIFREWNPGSFGFWPSTREWRIGIRYYAFAIVPIILLALGLHDVEFAPRQGAWWQVAIFGIGTFFGILWVVAISEELFFRGFIERFLLNVWNSRVGAVAVSSLLFGCAHLWFHQFPNWQRALVAALLGLACGLAYARTGSVRVPMVTHAFVVTTWRLFFK
jgi:uncharacterized protein